MSKKTLGVGVISLGWMGRLHTRGYKALAERFPEIEADVHLVAACDLMEANRTLATDVLGFGRAVRTTTTCSRTPRWTSSRSAPRTTCTTRSHWRP